MTKRQLVVARILVVIAAALAAQGLLARPVSGPAGGVPEEGMIHLYVDGAFRANLDPSQIMALPEASFIDEEEGKTQSGPWLKDVIALHVGERELQAGSTIRTQGIRRQGGEAREAVVTWGQALDESSHLLLDIAGSGDSLKLVSTLSGLDTRDTWVQGVARLDVTTKP